MTNTDTIFKRAELADLPAIVAIYNQIIPGKLVTAELAMQTVAGKMQWFESFSEEYPIWVMEKAGVTIGWISIEPYHPRPAYLRTVEVSIYIDEAYRKHGLGSVALAFAEEQALQRGHKSMVSLIFRQNQPSVKLFLKNGFETWGHLPRIAEMGEAKEDERDLEILGKRISE